MASITTSNKAVYGRDANENGEGEIRTPATLAGRPVFETGEANSLNTDQKANYANRPDCLAVLLGAAKRVDSDLASVIAAWQHLAPAIRAAILAMITASEKA